MASSKGKVARMSTVVSNLEKYWHEYQDGGDAECFDQVKLAVGRFQHALSSQDKVSKDVLIKNPNVVDVLSEMLQFSCKIDHGLTIQILECFSILSSTAKGLSHLHECGLFRHLCDTFTTSSLNMASSREPNVVENTWILFHTLINKFASKEKKFGTILRLSGVLDSSIKILTLNSCNHKVSSPIMQMMKNSSTSLANVSLMVKGGVLQVLLQVLPICGQKKNQLLKTSLDLLMALCKSKVGCRKAVSSSVLTLMLSMYQDWHRWDHRNRQITIRKCILNVIKACVMFSFGQQAFLSVEGFKTLYFLGLEGIECKELDGVLRVIIVILRKCSSNVKLPIKSTNSCLKFDLPVTSVTTNAFTNDNISEGNELTANESSTESDKDFDSSRENNGEKEEGEVEGEDYSDSKQQSKSHLLETSSYKDLEEVDLSQYRTFLQELIDFPVHQLSPAHIEDDCISQDEATLIRIPTACQDDAECSDDVDSKSVEGTHNEDMATVNSSADSLKISGTHDSLSLDDTTDLNDVDTSVDNKLCRLALEVESTSSSLAELSDCFDSDCLHSANLDSELLAKRQPVVQNVLPFVKDISHALLGHTPPSDGECLVEKTAYLHRVLMFQDFARTVFNERIVNRVVYDLDGLLANSGECKGEDLFRKSSPIKKSRSLPKFSPFKRTDSPVSGQRSLSKEDILKRTPLSFESRFESGNLRKAIQVRQYEYDLILNADVNTNHHHQWFFFQVEGMECNAEYRFNLVNCEKPNSQYNFGMQPLLYSRQAATHGLSGWERTGTKVCYYRNHFVKGRVGKKNYYTATFSLFFPFSNDTCYLAYHYPYTLTMLHAHLRVLENYLIPTIYFRRQVLCRTLSNNDVTLITVTSLPFPNDENDVMSRPYVLLTARVHPGESNSSWVMKGVLDYLVSNDTAAKELRSTYVFKIIPMLNPDGVVNGCHRCSLSGQDLNRQWKQPLRLLHPSIYHTKRLLQLMKRINKTPVMMVDFHGHSRKKNVFLYGCSTSQSDDTLNNSSSNNSTSTADELNHEIYACAADESVKMFPRVLNGVAPYFSLSNCAFTMEKSKESTARIVGFKEFGIKCCYTMESTYCGMDQGHYKGFQIGTTGLQEMGRSFCLSLWKFSNTSSFSSSDANVDLSALWKSSDSPDT